MRREREKEEIFLELYFVGERGGTPKGKKKGTPGVSPLCGDEK